MLIIIVEANKIVMNLDYFYANNAIILTHSSVLLKE
jgi:hypothetical protein